MKNLLLLFILISSAQLSAQSNVSKKPSYKVNNPEKIKKNKTTSIFSLMSKVRKTSLILSVGHNIMTSPKDHKLEQKWWSSTEREIGIGFKRSIGKAKKYKFFYGISINTKKVDLVGIDFDNSKSDPGYLISTSDAFEKVRIGAKYVQLPIGIIIPVFKNKKIFIGGHFGYKYKSFVEKEFKSVNDEDVKAFYYSGFGMTKFNYGIDISLGYKYIKLFTKYDVSPLFTDGTNHNIFSFGLRTY